MLDNDRQVSTLTRREWLALLGAASTTGIAGCLPGESSSDGPTTASEAATLTPTPGPADVPPVHFLTDYNNEAWQARWEDELLPPFTDETGVDVEVEYSGFQGQGESRLSTLIQSGEPPALHTSTMAEVSDLLASDRLAPLQETVSNIESVAGEDLAPAFSRDGETWQVSHGHYVATFLYREDVYDELGLSVPETFQELLDNARTIDESDLSVRGYGFAGGKVGKANTEFGLFLANMGVEALRWQDPDVRDAVEIWYPEEEVTWLLDYVEELAQYSPDPTGISWSTSIQNWLGGQFAQQYHLNAWPAGIAGQFGLDTIAKNTGVAPFPLWEEGGITKEDSRLSTPAPDGYHVFSDSENPEGAKRLVEWLYGDSMERTAGMYVTEPTRFLPNYADVLESDTFQGFSHWQGYPKHLEQLEYTRDTILGEYYGNVPAADLDGSPVALYVARFQTYADMVNQVVTGSSTPVEAYQFGLEQFERRVEEGRETFDVS